MKHIYNKVMKMTVPVFDNDDPKEQILNDMAKEASEELEAWKIVNMFES